jgi:hypothetical protein
MVQDLEKLSALATEKNNNYYSSGDAPPESLRQLGAGVDYEGVSAQMIKLPDYAGPGANIVFGNKVRNWGLCIGKESFVTGYSPGCKFVRVETNAFFYVGNGR